MSLAIQLIGVWISAACLIVAIWGVLGAQWTRRKSDMQRRDFHDHGYSKSLLLGDRDDVQ